MHSQIDTPSPMVVFIFLGAIIFISRLVRWARLLSPNSPSTIDTTALPPRRCLWGPARKLEKITESTALVRAEAELFHSKIDHAQAQHHFDRLLSELRPPPQRPPDVGRRGAHAAGLTLVDIEQLLAAMPELNPEVRNSLLELLAARLQEKN